MLNQCDTESLSHSNLLTTLLFVQLGEVTYSAVTLRWAPPNDHTFEIIKYKVYCCETGSHALCEVSCLGDGEQQQQTIE